MPRKRLTLCLVLVATMSMVPYASPAPVGTAFTYQGRLVNGGSPANASFDLEFRLFDAPSAGSPVGSPVDVPSVAVVSGLFTVSLDFGFSPFAGEMRWLEIGVKPAGSPNPYVTLTPRQVLTPAPYSVFSSYTDPAHLTNLNASNLTSGTVPSGQLTGSYTSPLAFTNPGNAFVGDGSGLTNLNAQAKLRRTIVVTPVGLASANGTVLLAALASISAPSAADPWLIKIEPGVYDVGAPGALVMKPFVDIEGSGESVTKITASGSGTNTAGTVQVVSNSELRRLTVENRGGAAYARALYVTAADASARISHVTVVSSGGTSETQGFFADGLATATVTDLTAQAFPPNGSPGYGVLNVNASPTMTNVQSFATGGSFAQAVWNCCGAAPILRNFVAIASGGTTENRGMANVDSSGNLENVVAIGTGAAGTNYGIYNLGTAAPTMRFVDCRAIGATGNNYGCSNFASTHPTMMDVFAEGAGGTNAQGIHNETAVAGLSLTHIRAVASGASTANHAVEVNAGGPSIVDMEAVASGAASSEVVGVSISNASPSLSHVTAVGGSSGSGNVAGVHAVGGTTAPTLSQVAASANGGANAWGIWNNATSALTLANVTISAAGGAISSVGLFNQTATAVTLTNVAATSNGTAGANSYGIWNQAVTLATLSNVRAVAAGGALSYGIFNGTTASTVKIDRSTVSGGTNSIQNGIASTVNVGGSQLVGAVGGAASFTCVFSFSGSFVALNAGCN